MPVQRKQRTKRPSAMDIFSRDEGQLLSELVDGLSDPELERTETEQLETLAMLEQLADSEGRHAPASANPDVGALMLSMLPEDDSLVSPLSRQGTMLSMLHEQGVPSMAAAAAAAAAGPMAGAPRSSTPDSLATQFAAAQLAGDAAARQRGGRSGAERKEEERGGGRHDPQRRRPPRLQVAQDRGDAPRPLRRRRPQPVEPAEPRGRRRGGRRRRRHAGAGAAARARRRRPTGRRTSPSG